MKRSLSIIIALLLLSTGLLGVSVSHAQFGSAVGDAVDSAADAVIQGVNTASQNTGNKNELPPGCAELVGEDSSVQSAPVSADVSDEIIVLLSEGITRNGGESFSCSEVIYCLQKKFSSYINSEGKKVSNSVNMRDKLVLSFLQQGANKKKYEGCYVSGEDGLDLLNNYARMIYQWIAGIVGSVCIMIIIFSGIQISLGGVNPDDVQAAKDRISRSLVGLVVLFLSALILYTINPIFFG